MEMYWFTKTIIKIKTCSLISLGIGCFFVSCDTPSQNKVNTRYFDIPTYFEKQILEFQKNNPLVIKTVSTNEETEEKELHIDNWNNELSAFLAMDINKAAYQGYIEVDSLENEVKYISTNENLELKYIRIVYKNNQPIEVEIEKMTKNFLYQTDEKLHFYSDSLYSIQKTQKVIFMNPNGYKITGLILE